MKALVVYDSVFGNTKEVAEAVAGALANAAANVAGASTNASAEVSAVQVKDADANLLKDLDILVVGSPTRAFKATPAVSGFLKQIAPGALTGVSVSGFDTRISVDETNSKFLSFMVKIFGYAAEPIAAKLKKKGGTLRVTPEGFFVGGTEGPLKEGELDRAAAWAKELHSQSTS